MKIRLLVWTLIVSATLSATLSAVNYVAFESLQVDNTARSFSAAKITPNATGGGSGSVQATQAVCRLEGAEIRYQVSGVVPTSGGGILLEIGDFLVITGHDLLVNFLAIRTGSTNGVLNCTYTQQ